jgi:hypothetical protein
MVYKPWKSLTDTEKGKLLLAYHEGQLIEMFFRDTGEWNVISPCYFDASDGIYRVKNSRTAEEVVATIIAGEFYDDYDQSSSDLGVLRDLLKERDALLAGHKYLVGAASSSMINSAREQYLRIVNK